MADYIPIIDKYGRRKLVALSEIINTPAQIAEIKAQLRPTNDWFLPSRGELVEMGEELYLHAVGNLLTAKYWSSTENDATTAMAIHFGGGGDINELKSNALNIRAIRAFTSLTNYNLRDIGPASGWVFWKSGNDYLEAAPEDITAAIFSNITSAIGTTSTALYSGQSNTTAIIAQSGHTNSAAKLCDDLIVGGTEVTLTTEQIEAIAALIPATDISGKVDKVTGYSLVPDVQIAKLIGMPNITVSATAPASPALNDIWIDIS